LPSWPGTTILPISVSQVARITGMNHSAQPTWLFLNQAHLGCLLKMWVLISYQRCRSGSGGAWST
jgi:hypothetical protein